MAIKLSKEEFLGNTTIEPPQKTTSGTSSSSEFEFLSELRKFLEIPAIQTLISKKFGGESADSRSTSRMDEYRQQQQTPYQPPKGEKPQEENKEKVINGLCSQCGSIVDQDIKAEVTYKQIISTLEQLKAINPTMSVTEMIKEATDNKKMLIQAIKLQNTGENNEKK